MITSYVVLCKYTSTTYMIDILAQHKTIMRKDVMFDEHMRFFNSKGSPP